MLKIREYDDNGNKIDLKELEKYGFKFREGFNLYVRYYFEYGNVITMVDEKSRIIDNVDDSFIQFGLPDANILLADLIKADLVEKSDDNE